MLKKYKIANFDIEIEFIREKYGLARWDYKISLDGKLISMGCDRNTVSFDEKEAIIEMLLEDFTMEDEQDE